MEQATDDWRESRARGAEPAADTAGVTLSVVVPVYNEAENVPGLLAEIRAALAGRVAYEVVVVDDGSADGTADALRAARAEDPRVRILRHRTRAGQSAALRTGVRAARGPWIATLDGDGQNDPRDILPLYARARADGAPPGARLVAGYRRQRRDGLSKRIASRVANAIRRRLLGDGTPDSGCGLKVFGRAAFLELPAFDHMHRFLPALFLAAGVPVESVDVHHRPRTAGRSKYGIADRAVAGVIDLLGVAWLRRRAAHPHADEIS